MTAEEMVECVACGGCGVDEGGELPIRCPACGGFGSLSWRRVLWLDMASRYPASVQLEQAAAAVADFGATLGGDR